jgi:hypothetical protein
MKSPLETIGSASGLEKCPRGHDAYSLVITTGSGEATEDTLGYTFVPRRSPDAGELIRDGVFGTFPDATDYVLTHLNRGDFNSARLQLGIMRLASAAMYLSPDMQKLQDPFTA